MGVFVVSGTILGHKHNFEVCYDDLPSFNGAVDFLIHHMRGMHIESSGPGDYIGKIDCHNHEKL